METTLPSELPDAEGGSTLRRLSLPEINSTIRVPRSWPAWKRLLAFVGPGYLIAVGYMDPGNWATDIGGGSAYNYQLLSVVAFASVTAIYLQALSAKLGLVTGRDLAQMCRDSYAQKLNIGLWISAEIAIVACDVAEVIGAAIALKLLFNVPMVVGVVATSADVLIILAMQRRGFRWIEALVFLLIALMMVIFGIETFYAKPDWLLVAGGLVPSTQVVKDPHELYIALGILGATVMPHNLYLHSSIVQTRQVEKGRSHVKEAIKFAYIDSTFALFVAMFANAALLIVAAAVFYKTGHTKVQGIDDAYPLLRPLLGTALAAPLFAVALLAAGQNSTLTGTLAGQVILEGFTDFKMKPWLRRMVSRMLAIVPAATVVIVAGDKGLNSLMIFSQVVLSAQLSFAVVPLIQFTSDKTKMGEFVNGTATKVIGWGLAVIIAVLNAYLIYVQLVQGGG